LRLLQEGEKLLPVVMKNMQDITDRKNRQSARLLGVYTKIGGKRGGLKHTNCLQGGMTRLVLNSTIVQQEA